MTYHSLITDKYIYQRKFIRFESILNNELLCFSYSTQLCDKIFCRYLKTITLQHQMRQRFRICRSFLEARASMAAAKTELGLGWVGANNTKYITQQISMEYLFRIYEFYHSLEENQTQIFGRQTNDLINSISLHCW